MQDFAHFVANLGRIYGLVSRGLDTSLQATLFAQYDNAGQFFHHSERSTLCEAKNLKREAFEV